MQQRRCVIIGASPTTDADSLSRNISQDDYVICADGGYVFAEKAGILPDLIVGDFDSAKPPVRPVCEIIRLPVAKNDTDMHYCVREGIRRGFRFFALYGADGGRPEHTYANLCTLLYLTREGCIGTLEGSSRRFLVMKKGTVSITDEVGTDFSIFPFGCSDCRVTLKGFVYELQTGTLNADYPMGVSNTIQSKRATVTVHYGTALLCTGLNPPRSNGQ